MFVNVQLILVDLQLLTLMCSLQVISWFVNTLDNSAK